jgi:hypothetical protein
MDSNSRRTARLPLPLALAASFALASPVPAAAGGGAPTLVATHTLMLATAASPVATAAVINCADAGAGSLRDAIGSAANGATIDMSQLLCSTITLASGTLEVGQNNLTVLGPGRTSLQIKPDAGKKIPVFTHTGSGLLTIGSLRASYGRNYDASVGGGCITSPNGSVRVVAAEVSHCLSYQTVDNGVRGGGAIYAKGSVTIDDSLVAQNIAYGSLPHVAGGGAFSAGNIFVHRSVIDGNQAAASSIATGAAGWGGGLSAKRSIEIVASTISKNVAGVVQGASSNPRGYGGGVFALNYYGGSTLTLTNSTVSNNSSGLYTGGVMSSAMTHVSNSTIAFNTAQHGYSSSSKSNVGIGLLVYSEAATLDSTIIAKNSNFSGQQESYDFSLSSATVSGSNNLITISGVSPPGTLTSDPKLVALADNGGPTQTHALGALSPAIGAGSNPLNLTSDQRGPGFSRVFARFVDIGAFQTGDAIFANGLDPPS